MFLFFYISNRFLFVVFFFSSRRRHTRWNCDWSSDVCSSDLIVRARGLYDAIWQMPVAMLPLGGAPGRETIVLRPVNSRDGMTADFARLPAPVVAELARALGSLPRAEFVHLHVHSEYSLLDGAAQLEKLVKKAKDLKFPAIALTDHGNLFGGIDFYLAAQKAGIKPILGAERDVAPGKHTERGSQDGGYEGANHLTVR